MSKNKYKNLRICANYARPCSFANKCESCKHRAMKLKKEYGKTFLKLIGCKAGYDIEATAEQKEKCFFCTAEGTEKCKGD